MQLNITVVIPTYNGANRLPQVLERLRSQVDTEAIAWEILVVDNNSSDHTAQVVQQMQANWPPSVGLRYCFEPRQGLALARQRGVEEALGEWVAFMDDDNLPAPNWVKAAVSFGQEHPQAGAYGSKIQGIFEVDPPQHLRKIMFYLALVDRGPQPSLYQPRQNGVPPGAGLVVRRQAWLAHVPQRLVLAGRIGTALQSGEDFEALLHIYRGGWEIWHNPAMEIDHLIAAQRVEVPYLLKLMRGIGLCRHHLRMMLFEPWQRPFAFGLYLLSDTAKLLLYLIRHRTVLKSDTLVACELERLMGTLISPFYLTQLKFNRPKI